MTQQRYDAATKVKRGAVMMDELRSDWWQHVDPDNLVMGRTRSCVLGQIYGTVYHGMASLGISETEAIWGGLKLSQDELSNRFAQQWRRGVRHDLHIRVHDDHTRAWRAEITRRANGMDN